MDSSACVSEVMYCINKYGKLVNHPLYLTNRIYWIVTVRNTTMEIIAQCPICSCTWLLDEGKADKRLYCTKCGRPFKIPMLEEVPKAKNVIEQAKGIVYVNERGKTFGWNHAYKIYFM